MSLPAPSDGLLAALLTAFPAGLLVCDADRVIRYHNARAAELLRPLAPEAALTDRPATDLFDTHVLEDARRRAGEAADRPAFFAIPLRTEQRLRVQVHPLDDNGFLLILRPVRQWAHLDRAPDQFLQKVTEGIRAPLASMRAAAETMVEYPEMDGAVAEQFKHIILDQAVHLSDHLNETLKEYSSHFKRRWLLETMAGTDLLQALHDRLAETLNLPICVQLPEEPVKVQVDGYTLTEGFAHLASLVRNAVRPEQLTLRLAHAPPFVRLDLVWTGGGIRLERLRKWEMQPLDLAGTIITMTLREVIQHHDAEIWTQTEGDEAYVRLILPAPDDGA